MSAFVFIKKQTYYVFILHKRNCWLEGVWQCTGYYNGKAVSVKGETGSHLVRAPADGGIAAYPVLYSFLQNPSRFLSFSEQECLNLWFTFIGVGLY